MIARFRRVFSSISRSDWIVIGWTIGSTVFILAFGVISYQILGDRYVGRVEKAAEIWNRWDAVHYQEIAQSGYDATSDLKTWFFPLYPWVIRGVAWLGCCGYVASSFIVSCVACVAAALLLRRLVELDFSRAIALRAVWFFLIFPTAYFLHIGYTESLFLSLALGCFLAARTQRWWLAGLLGGLGAMTRSTGMILIPALAVEAVQQMLQEKRWRWSALWLALVPLGFGVYLLLNWKVTGDPFAFLELRKEVFHLYFTWPWVGIAMDTHTIFHTPPSESQTWAHEVLFTAVGLVGAIVSWVKLRPSYSIWIGGVWLLSTSANYVNSMPRYDLTMFPLFILLALIAANRFWNGLITVSSLLLLALFISLFTFGHWAF